MPRECRDVIDSMLQISPLDRARPKEILQSDWLSDVSRLDAELCGDCVEPEKRWWQQKQVKRALIALAYLSVCLLLLLTKDFIAVNDELITASDEHAT